MIRIMDRFYQQLSGSTGDPLVKQFRFSKYLLLTTLKSLWILILVPLFINFLSKNYLFRPLTEYFWNQKQTEIFLNFELQERAFEEIRDFEEKMYFESLVQPLSLGKDNIGSRPGGSSEEFFQGEVPYSAVLHDIPEEDALASEAKLGDERLSFKVEQSEIYMNRRERLPNQRMDQIVEHNFEQKMTELL